MEEREHVSFQVNRMMLLITSTKCDELYILNENTTGILLSKRRHTYILLQYLKVCPLNPSKTKVNLNYICRSTSQRAETTLRLGYKNLSVNFG